MRAEGLRHPHAGPFTLSVAAGTCLAVTGPSGAGKSLLLRMIADLIPHEGEAWLGETRRSALTAPAWRRQVTYGAAEPGWWHEQAGVHFLKSMDAEAGQLGLPADIFARRVSDLSTGERSRLALLRILALRPAVLLLDEPTGALDEAASLAAETLLRDAMARGTALILVTHSAAQAGRLGTKRAELRAGRLSPV